jgi:hypothetical protein
MSRHRIKRNEFRLDSGAVVSIEYWIDSTTASVAAYDADGHQISLSVYHASVDNADDFTQQAQDALVSSLANMLEYDLMNHPEIYVRPR